MSRIDYSKWDKIDCSTSSDDDNNEDEEEGTPRVTRLDTPSRITRTADGKLIVEQQEQSLTAKPAKQQEQLSSGPPPTTLNTKNPTKERPRKEKWIENGSHLTTKDGLSLYWSQDRYSICLRLTLPCNDVDGDDDTKTTIRARDIRVRLEGVIPFPERFSAVGGGVSSIELTCKNKILLQDEFPHRIHSTEEDSGDDYNYEWEIDRVSTEDNNSNNNNKEEEVAYWVMTFQKATPMEGLVIWWKHPLKQFPQQEIRQVNPNHDKNKESKQAFQQAWEEAHRQFREKTKQKQNLP